MCRPSEEGKEKNEESNKHAINAYTQTYRTSVYKNLFRSNKEKRKKKKKEKQIHTYTNTYNHNAFPPPYTHTHTYTHMTGVRDGGNRPILTREEGR